MPRGIFYVESRPVSAERDAEFNTWYEQVHMPQIVALDGFVSARRLRPADEEGLYIALYEIEGDDLQAVVQNMIAAQGGGEFDMSDSLQMDPPPVYRLLEVTSEYAPVGN